MTPRQATCLRTRLTRCW